MNTKFSRALATLLIVLISSSPAWATCGGGGGGGTGGVAGGAETGTSAHCLQGAVEYLGSEESSQ